MAGRPKGSRSLISQNKVYDELIRRNFNILDKVIELYETCGEPELRLSALKMLMEYCFPKRKPEDALGDATEAPLLSVSVTDEQLARLVKVARGEEE